NGGGTPSQRSISHTVFQTAVAPGNAPSAAGRTSTAYLDELGRTFSTWSDFGAGSPNQWLISRRAFDTLGRVVFESDPYSSSQNPATAYGTTYFFNPDGTPLCSVRGKGQQAAIPGSVDANNVVHPTTHDS